MRAAGGMDTHTLSGSFRTTGWIRRISLAILALTICLCSRSLLAEADSDVTSWDNEKGQRHVESCCPQQCLPCPSDVHPWHPDSLPETDEPSTGQPLLGPSAPLTAASAPRTVTPNMIGDFFGSGGSTIMLAFPRLVRQFRSRTVFPAGGAGPLNPILTGSFNPVLFTPFGPPPVESAMTQMDIDQILADPTLPESFVLLPRASIASAAAIALGADEVVFVSSKADRVAFGGPPASGPGSPLDPKDLFLLYSVFDVFDIVTVVDKITIRVPRPGRGGAVLGRLKIAENTSPLPRHRLFFNYSYFDNVPLAAGGVNVNRFTPGFEKTFFGDMMSIEMRFPFAATLDSSITSDGVTNTDELEFGNVTVALKALLYSDRGLAISAGLAFDLPTADDVNVNTASGVKLIEVENNAIHLLPFIGALFVPDDRFFAQGFIQADFDANGNNVLITDGTRLRRAGTVNDSTFLFFDVSVGYWVYRSSSPSSRVSGIAPMLELHYNRSLQPTDVVSSGGFRVGTIESDIQILNAVFGMTVEMGRDKSLSCGYVTPIGNGSDQQFDGELRVFFNWFFGGQNDRPRTLADFIN